MKMTKSKLLASAAVAVVALAPSKANAFDEVSWDWDLDANKTITENINVNADLVPSGMVTLEKLQVNIGDVTAESIVEGIENNPPAGEADGTFTGTVNLDVDYETDGTGVYMPVNTTTATGGDIDSAVIDSAELTIDTAVDPDLESDNISLTISGEVAPGELGINDAIDLPKIESVATAVANNQSIESTVGLNLHEGQFNFGGFYTEENEQVFDPTQFDQEELAALGATAEAFFGASDATGNTNLDAALGLTLAGALGVITPGEVSATSQVGGPAVLLDDDEGPDTSIVNAFVDSAATAVGNNASIDVDGTTLNDAFVVADLTQFNYADVSANSSVRNLSVDDYTGFGAAGFGNCGGCIDEATDELTKTPLVKSVATAVGNNLSLSVSNAGTIQLP